MGEVSETRAQQQLASKLKCAHGVSRFDKWNPVWYTCAYPHRVSNLHEEISIIHLMKQLADRLLNLIRENWLLIAFLGLLAAGFLTLRTPATPIESEQALQATLSSGQPVLVEFYANT